MGFRQECAVVLNAKNLAAQRGLDPSKVVCCGCVEGTNCAFSSEDPLPISTMDAIQEMRLKRLENGQQLEGFDRKPADHFKAKAVVKNQHRSS